MSELLDTVKKEEALKTKPPKKWIVKMHNDDFTTMDFVVFVLQSVFAKSFDESTAIMLKIHQEGAAIVGVYTKEIAETKVEMAKELAVQQGHPLSTTMEEE